MTTALFLAAALVLGQSEAASPPAAPPAPQAATAAAPTVSVPTAAPASAPAGAAPQAQPAAPEGQTAVSTTPQEQLELQSTVRPFEMPAASPSVPIPFANADAAEPKAPVKVEDYHRSYEGPKDSMEAYYDAGVRGAFQAEQSLHGGLDGMWVLSAADGSPLLSLIIADPGEGQGRLGGAWRDLTRPHDQDASGLIDEMVRDGRGVIVRFHLRESAPPATLRLTPLGDGRWRGQLDDGRVRAVVMDRKAI